MTFKKINIIQILKDISFYPLRNSALDTAWLKTINTPVDYLYDKLLSIREKNLFLTNHTSQRLSLEHLFNNLTYENGEKIITGSPVYCETTGNIPLFYIFDDAEDIPNNTSGTYIFDSQLVYYNPFNTLAWTDTELETEDIENVSWMFSDDDSGSNEYTIWVDSVDFVGLSGYDSNNQPIYSNGSKLDIINKYAKQYSCLGVNYKIQIQ